MYTMEDGSADRVQIGTDAEGHPIYDQYAIWYVQFESVSADGSREDFRLPNTDIYSKDSPDGVLICSESTYQFTFSARARLPEESSNFAITQKPKRSPTAMVYHF